MTTTFSVRLCLFSIILCFFATSSISGTCAVPEYDTVIVGAGLAGLSAAYQLNGHKVLVLEKENNIGGRITSRTMHGITFDTGAIFPYDDILPKLPFSSEPSELIQENNILLMYYNGKKGYGTHALECIQNVCSDTSVTDELTLFRNNITYDESRLSSEGYLLINAFFRAVLAGEMKDYIPSMQRVAFFGWNTSHHVNGNAELITQLAKRTNATILTGAEVTAVGESDGCVSITYVKEGNEHKTTAKTAIVTTPAPVTRKIVKNLNDATMRFLNSVQYRRYTVVAIGFQQATFEESSGIITPSLPTSGILKQKTGDPDKTLLLAYYADIESRQMDELTDEAIVNQTLEIIKQLDIGTFTDENILFSTVDRWHNGITMVTPEAYDDFQEAYTKASEHIVLAGDYLYFETKAPLGMTAAYLSGMQAGTTIHRVLTGDQ